MNKLLLDKLQAEIALAYSNVQGINIHIMQTYNRFNSHEPKYTTQLLNMRGEVDKLARKFFTIINDFNQEYDPKRWEDMEV